MLNETEMRITYENDTELAAIEARDRGFRPGVIVEKNGKKFKLFVISIDRLQRDVDREMQCSGYYLSEPNIVIVKDVTKEEIEKTVLHLSKNEYFEQLERYGF